LSILPDEAMMSCKRQKDFIHQENVLEIVDYRLSVEIVHGNGQKIPMDTESASERLARANTASTASRLDLPTAAYHCKGLTYQLRDLVKGKFFCFVGT
jgi:hypothetical protein